VEHGREGQNKEPNKFGVKIAFHVLKLGEIPGDGGRRGAAVPGENRQQSSGGADDEKLRIIPQRRSATVCQGGHRISERVCAGDVQPLVEDQDHCALIKCINIRKSHTTYIGSHVYFDDAYEPCFPHWHHPHLPTRFFHPPPSFSAVLPRWR